MNKMRLRSARYSIDTRVQFEPDEWGAYALNNIMLYDVRDKAIPDAIKERVEHLSNNTNQEIIEITVKVKVTAKAEGK